MIDWQRVTELRDEVGAEDFSEVVELFLEEVDEVIERLDSTPDPARYEEDLHFLKGSALNLGFKDFAAICADGEIKARTGQGDTVEVGKVVGIYQASKTLFLADQNADHAA